MDVGWSGQMSTGLQQRESLASSGTRHRLPLGPQEVCSWLLTQRSTNKYRTSPPRLHRRPLKWGLTLTLTLTLTLKSSYRRTDLAVFGIITITKNCHCTAIPLTRGEVISSVQRCSKPKWWKIPLRRMGCIVIRFTGLGPPMGHTTTPLLFQHKN